MDKYDYDPAGRHTKEEAEAAYEALFKELHGEESGNEKAPGDKTLSDKTTEKKIAVVGHREPDTDSICSAIAYARLKNEVDALRTYLPFRAGRLNDETAFILNYFGIPEPPLFNAAEDIFKIILVDHNDPACSAEGVREDMILEIIDHHSLAGAGTTEPIAVRIQPCGSTAAIIYEIYREKGIDPDRETAGLLCAAVISDTRLFRAENTTALDRLSGAALANIAGLDMEAFYIKSNGKK